MRLGTSTKHLSRLINGYAPTSPEMAVKLAVVTGYSVEFWLTHQARYVARRTYVDTTQEDIALVKSVLPGPCVSRLQKGWDLCAGSDSIAFLGSGGGAATAGAEWTWLKSSLMRTGMVWKSSLLRCAQHLSRILHRLFQRSAAFSTASAVPGSQVSGASFEYDGNPVISGRTSSGSLCFTSWLMFLLRTMRRGGLTVKRIRLLVRSLNVRRITGWRTRF